MSLADSMQITLRLPTRTLFEGTAQRLFAVAANGAFGMLPNHIDFVTALVPSVLVLSSTDGREQFFGIDEGVLVKQGHQVDIAIRSALSRLEAGIVRRFGDLRKPLA